MLTVGADSKVPIFTPCVRTAIVVSSTNKLLFWTPFWVCMFENSLLLDSRSSIHETLSSILASPNSNVLTFGTRLSRFEDRVEPLNLLLSGTVVFQTCHWLLDMIELPLCVIQWLISQFILYLFSHNFCLLLSYLPVFIYCDWSTGFSWMANPVSDIKVFYEIL